MAWPTRPVAESEPARAVALLRIELYSAMQMLTGDDLASFWKLIREISSCDTERLKDPRAHLEDTPAVDLDGDVLTERRERLNARDESYEREK